MGENVDDKGYRRMLSRKRTFLDFIKQHVAEPWTEDITEDDLVLVSQRFVSKDFRDKETDIIYRAKVADMDIIFYVLLELQSYVDFTIPFRLLEYSVEVLRSLFRNAGEKERERKEYKLPVVVPIVLYNGPGKWTCVRKFSEYVSGHSLFSPYTLDFEYIVVEVNSREERELEESPTLINLTMLLDRAGGSEDVLRRVKTALRISRRLSPADRTELKDWIVDVLLRKMSGKLAKEREDEIRESFKRGDDDAVTYAIERTIDEEVRLGEERAEKRNSRAIAQRLLELGLPMAIIEKSTGLTTDEINELVIGG
jgi:predicted transposase/invertase (TIGR01784 family)